MCVNPTTLISDSVCKQAYPTLHSTLLCPATLVTSLLYTTLHSTLHLLPCENKRFTMTLALSAFSTFDTTDTSNLAPRWRRYVQRFENRATALNILSAERKIALLLDYAGEAVYDDFQTLVVPAPEAENPRDIYQRSLQALNDLYAPKVQVEYERFNFREATQLLDENLRRTLPTRRRTIQVSCLQRRVSPVRFSWTLRQEMPRRSSPTATRVP